MPQSEPFFKKNSSLNIYARPAGLVYLDRVLFRFYCIRVIHLFDIHIVLFINWNHFFQSAQNHMIWRHILWLFMLRRGHKTDLSAILAWPAWNVTTVILMLAFLLPSALITLGPLGPQGYCHCLGRPSVNFISDVRLSTVRLSQHI